MHEKLENIVDCSKNRIKMTKKSNATNSFFVYIFCSLAWLSGTVYYTAILYHNDDNSKIIMRRERKKTRKISRFNITAVAVVGARLTKSIINLSVAEKIHLANRLKSISLLDWRILSTVPHTRLTLFFIPISILLPSEIH